MIVPVGKGKVGVIGPHPEGDETWYEIFPGKHSPVMELFVDFVDSTCGLLNLKIIKMEDKNEIDD